MAFSADDAAKLQQKLFEIERLSRLLGANINLINLQPLEENAGNIEVIFQRLTNQAAGFGEETDYLVSNFQRLVGELKNSNTGIGNATKSLRGLSSIAEQISSYQRGYNDLSSKDVIRLKQKAQIEADRLNIAKKTIQDEIVELELQKNSLGFSTLEQKQQDAILNKLNKNIIANSRIDDLLQNQDITLGDLNTQLYEAELKAKNVEKVLGITGKTLKGISKIPILGDLINAEEALKAAQNAAKNGADKVGTMNAALGSLGKSLMNSLKDPLVAGGLLVGLFVKLVDLGFQADKDITNLSKSMAVSKDQAKELRNRFIEIESSGNSIFETTRNLIDAQLELANAFGATRGFTEQQVKDQVYLTKQIGLEVNEAANLQQLAMANRKNVDDVVMSTIKQTSSLARQRGIQLDNKKILSEVAKVSGQLRLQYQNNPDLISKAVIQTQKLGVSLEQAAKSSQHLLNFEESITDQISAELLTGKELNLERARLLSLNGDVAGSMQEMLSQVGNAYEFSKMNVIQQEALAKAVGMTADELANSLVQQENLNRLGAETKAQIQAQADELKKKGKVEEANQLMASLGDEKQAKEALDRISAQDKFNQAVEKLQSMLVNIVNGPMAGFLDKLVNFISKTENLKAILLTIKATMIGIAAAFAIMNPLAAAAGLATAASIYALSDGVVSNKGLVVGSYNKGTIQPIAQGRADDNVIFTTNKPTVNQSTIKNDIDVNILVNEQKRTNDLLSKLYNKEGVIHYDSDKAGKTANINSYQIQ